jgi:hypothetical protein
MIVALTGSDAVVLGGRAFADFADGDYASLEYENDLVEVKTAKNGNQLFSFKEMGRQCKFTLRLLLGSADDVYLNSQLETFKSANFSGVTLLTGTFTKSVGDGAGNITNKIYTLTNGVFKRQPNIKSNADGNSEQTVVVYEIIFANGNPTISA